MISRNTYHIFSTLMAFLLLVFSVQAVAADDDDNDLGEVDFQAAAVSGQLLYQIDPLSGATADDINGLYGLTALDTVSLTPPIYLVSVADNVLDDVLEQMSLDIRLLLAEPNAIGQTPEAVRRGIWGWGGESTTPYFDQYALRSLNLGTAHQVGRGAGVTVAIIDTGIQLNHPQLAAHLLPGFDFVDPGTPPDDEFSLLTPELGGLSAGGHGTHVAGLVNLIAPEAALMPLRVLDTNGQGDVFTLATAILYAADHGADVINLSLGLSEKSYTLDQAIEEASKRGALVVAAAGNTGTKEKQFPAAAGCVLNVTAVDEANRKADFASYGSWVDLVAPGVGIYSTFPVSGYAVWDGTSMAAPLVAGQAALLRGFDSSLSARQTALLIANTAQSVDQFNDAYDGDLGNGLPNIAASLHWLASGRPLPNRNGGIMSASCDG